MIRFDEFVGNEKLKDRLSKMIERRSVPQAMVFEGKQGLGKRTIVTQFVRALLCNNSDVRPCGVCPTCAKTKSLAHPDVTVIDGSQPKALSIDVIRNIRSDSFIMPNESNYKIYLFFNADSMQDDAQNAILKILEEPASYCVFIFTCENRSSLLPTVLSRAVSMELFPVDVFEAASAIKKILPGQDADNIEKAAEIFCGNIGAAVNSLCSGEFTKLYETSLRVLKALTALDEFELLRESASFEGDKELFSGCVSVLSLAVRDALTLRFGGAKTVSGFESEQLQPLKALTSQQLLALKNELDETKAALLRNPNFTLLITRFCARMRKSCGR